MPVRTNRPAPRSVALTAALRALMIFAAALSALATWAALTTLSGADTTVRTDGSTREVGAESVIVTSLVAGLISWVLLALLERFTGRPRTIWTVVASVLLLLSLTGLLTVGVDVPAKSILVILHLVVAAILIPGFRASVRKCD